MLKQNEFDFLTRDSVLKLNDIRTVSIKRIQYQHSGRIDVTSDTYKMIESLVIQKLFFGFYRDTEKIRSDNNNLIFEIAELEEKIEKLGSYQSVVHEIRQLISQTKEEMISISSLNELLGKAD